MNNWVVALLVIWLAGIIPAYKIFKWDHGNPISSKKKLWMVAKSIVWIPIGIWNFFDTITEPA